MNEQLYSIINQLSHQGYLYGHIKTIQPLDNTPYSTITLELHKDNQLVDFIIFNTTLQAGDTIKIMKMSVDKDSHSFHIDHYKKITTSCDRCHSNLDFTISLEQPVNALHVLAHGGYGQYMDGQEEIILCDHCADKFYDFMRS